MSNIELHDVTVSHVTFVRTLMIRQDGKLIARLPVKHHFTINADGEMVNGFSFEEVDCK